MCPYKWWNYFFLYPEGGLQWTAADENGVDGKIPIVIPTVNWWLQLDIYGHMV